MIVVADNNTNRTVTVFITSLGLQEYLDAHPDTHAVQYSTDS